jgi:hypothetical protein
MILKRVKVTNPAKKVITEGDRIRANAKTLNLETTEDKKNTAKSAALEAADTIPAVATPAVKVGNDAEDKIIE